MSDVSSEDEKTDPLEAAWKQHFEAMRTIRQYLEKEGGSIQVDIVVRDKTETEKYAKRKAAAKKRGRT